jgi:sugar lactone lactonase YvrE
MGHELADEVEVRCVADVKATLGEGPIWVASEQALYWVDIKGKKVFRLKDGDVTEWDTPCRVGSIAPRAGGGFIAGTDRGLADVDLSLARFDVFADPERDRPHNRFNDGKVDRAGRFWAGSMDDRQKSATGALYRIDPDRTVTRVDDEYRIANGPAFSPDGRTMYDNDTQRLVTYVREIDAEGRPSGRRTLIRHDVKGGHPDGITVDREGCIWIAFWGGWCIRRFAPSGECLRSIRLPVQQPSSCAFGGRDLERLFVTSARETLAEDDLRMQPSAGGLFVLEAGVQGIAEAPFAG